MSKISSVVQKNQGKFTSWKEDGESKTFVVADSAVITPVQKVWENGKFREPVEGDENVSTRYSLDIIVGNQVQTIEMSGSFFQAWDSKLTTLGADLADRVWKVTRVGAKGQKNTAYLFEAIKTIPKTTGDSLLAKMRGEVVKPTPVVVKPVVKLSLKPAKIIKRVVW